MGIFRWLKEQWEEAGKFQEDTPAPAPADNRPLEERIAEADGYLWTKDELNAWLDTLPERARTNALQACKRLARQGQDWMLYLCRIRVNYENQQKEIAARDEAERKANRTTLGSLLWAWDEGMKMGEERRFYQEQHERWQKEKKEKGW